MKPDVIFIAITMADQSLAIMQFVTCEYSANGKTVWQREASEKNISEELARAQLKDVASWRIIHETDIPRDRTFRNAWRDDGKTIYVDMPTASELCREQLRRARKPLFEALDVEYQMADEKNAEFEKAEIARKKQFLRDVTQHPSIATAATPEALLALVSGLLNSHSSSGTAHA